MKGSLLAVTVCSELQCHYSGHTHCVRPTQAGLCDQATDLLTDCIDGWNCRTTQAGLTNVLGALYATTLFFSIINATVIQPVISAERAVSYRERAAGMYSVLPFTLALVGIVFTFSLAHPLCCSFFWSCLLDNEAKLPDSEPSPYHTCDSLCSMCWRFVI